MLLSPLCQCREGVRQRGTASAPVHVGCVDCRLTGPVQGDAGKRQRQQGVLKPPAEAKGAPCS